MMRTFAILWLLLVSPNHEANIMFWVLLVFTILDIAVKINEAKTKK